MILLATVILSFLSIGQAHLLSGPSGANGIFTTIPSLYQQQTRGGAVIQQQQAPKHGAEKVPQEFLNGGNVEMRKKFEKLCRDAQVCVLLLPPHQALTPTELHLCSARGVRWRSEVPNR
jgi:hypothetical protein